MWYREGWFWIYLLTQIRESKQIKETLLPFPVDTSRINTFQTRGDLISVSPSQGHAILGTQLYLFATKSYPHHLELILWHWNFNISAETCLRTWYWNKSWVNVNGVPSQMPPGYFVTGYLRMISLSKILTAAKMQVKLHEVNTALDIHKMFKLTKDDGWPSYTVDLSLNKTQMFLNVVSLNLNMYWRGGVLFPFLTCLVQKNLLNLNQLNSCGTLLVPERETGTWNPTHAFNSMRRGELYSLLLLYNTSKHYFPLVNVTWQMK